MNSFEYYNPTKMIFGENSVDKLQDLLKTKNVNILLHYGGGSIKKSGLYDKVISILVENNIEYTELSGVEPNPKLSLVRKGIEICKKEKLNFILAIGGGSVIDSAKAIAVGAKDDDDDDDVWDYFIGKKNVNSALPIGVILTIPATGSETSPNSIVTNEDGLLKMGIESDFLRPEFAIMDPVLTTTLPESGTFAGIVDIVSHIIERYFTNTTHVDLTDRLCEASLISIIENAYILKNNPNDIDARAEIMLSGTIAHGGILGLGREEDWGSHRIGHELTALYGTTHGVTLSIVIPAWMKYVYKQDISRFVKFAERIFGISADGESPEEIAILGIHAFEKFIKDINMPIRLSDFNIPTTDFQIIAKKCVKDSYVGRFKKLYYDDVIKILNLAK